MINLTVKQALEVTPVINELMTVKLPIKAAYKIAKLARKMTEQLSDYESQRIVLIKEMGVVQPDGNYSVPPEQVPVFLEKLQQLLPENLTIESNQITIEELGDVSLTPLQLLVMEQNQILITT